MKIKRKYRNMYSRNNQMNFRFQTNQLVRSCDPIFSTLIHSNAHNLKSDNVMTKKLETL